MDAIRQLIKQFELRGDTDVAFFEACRWGLRDEVERLRDAVADANCTDSKDRTALGYACSGGHFDIVELLLCSGANPNLVDEDGKLPIDWLLDGLHSDETYVAICQLLFDHGQKLRSTDEARLKSKALEREVSDQLGKYLKSSGDSPEGRTSKG